MLLEVYTILCNIVNYRFNNTKLCSSLIQTWHTDKWAMQYCHYITYSWNGTQFPFLFGCISEFWWYFEYYFVLWGRNNNFCWHIDGGALLYIEHINKWNAFNKLYVMYYCSSILLTSMLMEVVEYGSSWKSILSYSPKSILRVFLQTFVAVSSKIVIQTSGQWN
jgi:hypothetical protein